MNRVVEVAGLVIGLQASQWERIEAIDAMCGTLASIDAAPVFEIEFGIEPIALPAAPWDHADGDVRSWIRPDALFLAHGDFSVRVDATSARIGGTGHAVRAFRQLFPYVLAHFLAPYECFVLHGGAIHRAESTALVLGGTGSGKSTLVVGALCAGWTALGDDLVVVRSGVDGPEVIGIPRPLSVPGELAGTVPREYEGEPIPGDPRGRWRIAAGDEGQEWHRVTATLVAVHGATNDSAPEILTSEALATWLLYSYLARHDADRLREYVPVAASITRRGGWEVHHSVDPQARVAHVAASLRAGARLEDYGLVWLVAAPVTFIPRLFMSKELTIGTAKAEPIMRRRTNVRRSGPTRSTISSIDSSLTAAPSRVPEKIAHNGPSGTTHHR